jgi:hypothetical protein
MTPDVELDESSGDSVEDIAVTAKRLLAAAGLDRVIVSVATVGGKYMLDLAAETEEELKKAAEALRIEKW